MILEQQNQCKRSHLRIILPRNAGRVRAVLKILFRGLNTVYIQRSTEDLDEDMTAVRSEVDLFIDGTRGDHACGLGELADILGA
jgi:hypothetical protein